MAASARESNQLCSRWLSGVLGAFRVVKMDAFRFRLGHVRCLVLVLVLPALMGCRVLTSGLAWSGDASAPKDATVAVDTSKAVGLDGAEPVLDVGEPMSTSGPPLTVGCSDGTREGFRDLDDWPEIAGCAGAFDQMGVIGKLQPACHLQAGDSGINREGKGCSAADLCAERWHPCRNGTDVADHSPTRDCEGCVPAGEPRFFLVASGASGFGVCSADPEETNDLHGCGWLGQPESAGCSPLNRRMGFADCLATQGIWECGDDSDASREAAVVTKRGLSLGGILCCKD